MNFRKVLFQVHLWVGLSLGLLFIAIGLSGTVLMFRTVPGIGQMTSDIRATAHGAPAAPEEWVRAAREGMDVPKGAAAMVILPKTAGDPAAIRFVAQGPRGGQGAGGDGRGAGPGGRASQPPDILVDPVSRKVLGTRATGMTPFMQFVHDMHGQLFMGRTGRLVVGWLGVGMTFLGLSGLYLWWPRKGQWKSAFIIRRNARGARLYREIHGAFGIWFFVIFIVVSFTSVAIVFPQPVRVVAALFTGGDAAAPVPAPQRVTRAPQVEPVPGAGAMDANSAIALVRSANPDAPVQSVTLPARHNQAITVTIGQGRGRPIFVDPYRASIMSGRDARPGSALDQTMGALHELHEGNGLGPVYWTLVLLSGFLPLLFVATGLTIWIKKRRQRLAAFVSPAGSVPT